MSQGGEKQPFDLCGGHPALDFVNSLDQRFDERGPVESLCDYADLLRFTQQTSLLQHAAGVPAWERGDRGSRDAGVAGREGIA